MIRTLITFVVALAVMTLWLSADAISFTPDATASASAAKQQARRERFEQIVEAELAKRGCK